MNSDSTGQGLAPVPQATATPMEAFIRWCTQLAISSVALTCSCYVERVNCLHIEFFMARTRQLARVSRLREEVCDWLFGKPSWGELAD
jgi:hypothetical protein